MAGLKLQTKQTSAEYVAIRLKDTKDKGLVTGAVLSSIVQQPRTCKAFLADVTLSTLPMVDAPLRFSAALHIHNIVEKCEIVSTEKAVPSAEGMLGDTFACRIMVDPLICVEKYSEFPWMGCFTLHQEGNLVGSGNVTDVIDPGAEARDLFERYLHRSKTAVEDLRAENDMLKRC